jgi:hypothetical protein
MILLHVVERDEKVALEHLESIKAKALREGIIVNAINKLTN